MGDGGGGTGGRELEELGLGIRNWVWEYGGGNGVLKIGLFFGFIKSGKVF